MRVRRNYKMRIRTKYTNRNHAGENSQMRKRKICSPWRGAGPLSHVLDKKLVSIRPTAVKGRINYMGVGLSLPTRPYIHDFTWRRDGVIDG